MTTEFFVTEDSQIIFNEIAPRVHNSGHFTQKLCNLSQFEAHIRAISGIEINAEQLKLKYRGYMKNILGENLLKDYQEYINNPNATIYLYCKKQEKTGRKMGHINVTNQ
jgi:phosphoribosylaminoimidazole carboxylase (NCAIR synthetase)